jgi:outer membrane protein
VIKPGLTQRYFARLTVLAASAFCCMAQAQVGADNSLSLRLDQIIRSVIPGVSGEAGQTAAVLSQGQSWVSCQQLSSARLNSLTLIETMAHVLCNTPGLNQALLLVDEQQAASDMAQSAFRPRLSARAELSARGIPSSNSGAGFLNSSATGSVGLSWVLFDAGARAATVEQSRQVLSSARANQQVAALNTVNEALRLYVDAATAFARLDALRETEAVARQSVQAAQVKYEAFVVSLAEKLQAQTALAQATLDRVRAEGVWDTARGLLALAMGFPVNQAMTLASIGTAFPATSAAETSSNLIDITKSQHPRLRAARADVMALRSRLDTIRAESNGTLALTASSGMTKDLSTQGSRFQNSVSGGLLASIPIFNGAEQQAREAQVLAQISSREEAVLQVERDLVAEVWRNAKLLETETQNLQASQFLLNAATQSYQITFGRYKAGVGSILELITTQSSLSTARAQLAQAQIGLAQARLRLEVATGRIVLAQ